MKINIDRQVVPVQSEVLALTSVVLPILKGILYSIKKEIIEEVCGYESVKLKMLPRLSRSGDGDVGIAFEWAVHDAIQNNEIKVIERLADAAKMCRLKGNDFASILFGVEKTGRSKIIDTAHDILNDDSRILTGIKSQPIKLKRYLNILAAAFQRPETLKKLPYSINGLWKADLFFGTTDTNRWLGTTLKINPNHLQGARGLRIGIIPASQGKSDKIRRDESKNLVICPLPYDGSFMELFYTGWGIVQQFLSADAQMPKEVYLPSPVDRQVAKELVKRRDFPVEEVIQALYIQSQTDLIQSTEKSVETFIQKEGVELTNERIIAPVALQIEK
jgi:hypothetical protein